MIRFITNQWYLLQLENYNLKRFWNACMSGSFIRIKQPRQHLVVTQKMYLVIGLALILQFLWAWLLAYAFVNLSLWVGLALFFFLSFLVHFIFLSIATLLARPIDYYLKQGIVQQAAAKVAGFPKLKVIGITGSYGKTTMKESLATVLAEKFKVLKTPENINTAVGVGRFILENLSSQVEILIVEMGAYQIGDIRQLCEVTPPHIGILTGINESHLERFGSIENTIQAKFEIVKYSKPSAWIVLSEDNDLVKQNYQKYAAGRKVSWYQNTSQMPMNVKPAILGSYISGVLNAVVLIAKESGMSDEQIKTGIAKIKPIPHRLQLMENANGVTVIDDSYNGNPAGVAEAIKVLASFKNKRKIYITPGLVEMGPRAKEVHNKIGEQLKGAVDQLILIKNSVTPFIAETFGGKIIWFDSAQQAHAALAQIVKPGDVVMFQNDWPDNYA